MKIFNYILPVMTLCSVSALAMDYKVYNLEIQRIGQNADTIYLRGPSLKDQKGNEINPFRALNVELDKKNLSNSNDLKNEILVKAKRSLLKDSPLFNTINLTEQNLRVSGMKLDDFIKKAFEFKNGSYQLKASIIEKFIWQKEAPNIQFYAGSSGAMYTPTPSLPQYPTPSVSQAPRSMPSTSIANNDALYNLKIKRIGQNANTIYLRGPSLKDQKGNEINPFRALNVELDKKNLSNSNDLKYEILVNTKRALFKNSPLFNTINLTEQNFRVSDMTLDDFIKEAFEFKNGSYQLKASIIEKFIW